MSTRSREEEYLRRMKALRYEPSLNGMDDGDIEWELSKMEEADRRREAEWQQPQQPLRTVYRPVDPGLKARILRQFGQPHDESAIPKGQEFYLNGWDNGEEEWPSMRPVPSVPAPSGSRVRKPDLLSITYDPETGKITPNENGGLENKGWELPGQTPFWKNIGDIFSPSRGGAYRPLSYTAGGNDVNTGGRGMDTAAANPYAGGDADGGAEGDMTLPGAKQQPRNNESDKMAYPDLNDEQKLFIATVAGEAGGSSENAQRAVAHVIMNRVGYKDWAKHDTVGKLLTPDQFSSINDPNSQPFQEMTKYLQNRDGSDPRLERLINTAMNVYHGKVPDFTGGAVMFYSPKAQAQLYRERPDLYLKEVPADWDFEQLQKLTVPIEEDDDFLFFKYK